jgi:endonuclease/exonuclease/phosphatase family metal-dependent hydrolase
MKTFFDVDNNVPMRKQGFRVCAFNVHAFHNFANKQTFEEIFETINNIDADVICLQEVFLSSANRQKTFKHFVSKTKYKHVYDCDPRKTVNVLLSKKKLQNVKVINLGGAGKYNRYCISAFAYIGTKKFQIMGCHLDVEDESEISRCKQMDIILSRVDYKNVIILGDLNSLRKDDYDEEEWYRIRMVDKRRNVVPKTLLIDKLESNKFVDSFVRAKTKPPSISVWSNRRVDYIFVKSKMIKHIQSYVHKTLCSDHYPVYTDIE